SFYVLEISICFVQGGCQSLSQSIYRRMVPADKKAEFFGFYGISSKFAAVLSPFIFALVGQLPGSSRFGIISLIIFFIAGIVLLKFVDIERGMKEAKVGKTA